MWTGHTRQSTRLRRYRIVGARRAVGRQARDVGRTSRRAGCACRRLGDIGESTDGTPCAVGSTCIGCERARQTGQAFAAGACWGKRAWSTRGAATGTVICLMASRKTDRARACQAVVGIRARCTVVAAAGMTMGKLTRQTRRARGGMRRGKASCQASIAYGSIAVCLEEACQTRRTLCL